MKYDSRLELSYYKEIAVLNEKHRVYLVQHIESKEIFVKKVLTTYNIKIYRSLKKKQFPGIPKIFCLHEENNELTIIEEYIAGKTLSELLESNGAFNEEETRHYILMLCDILNKIHNATPSLIHRDIKPSNIIITRDDNLYLIDFNSARENTEKSEDTYLLGTPGYAAPEQYGFSSSDVRTDIFSVGILINTMLHGFLAKDVLPASELTPVIRRCTRLEPSERYANIYELKADLSTGNSSSRDFRRFLPPGFRENKIWHMIVASIFYFALSVFNLSVMVTSERLSVRIFIVILLTLGSLIAVAGATNYLGIQRLLPLYKSPYRIVRLINAVLIIVLGWTALYLIGMLFSYYFFN